MIEIIIGAVVGIVFGIIQVLILTRVVEAVTGTGNAKPGGFIWIVPQFLVTVAAFAALGFYSNKALLAAAGGLIIATFVVWMIRSNKPSGKEE